MTANNKNFPTGKNIKLKINLLGMPKMVYGDYYKPSLYIPIGVSCNWKCCIEQGLDISICQNSKLNNIVSIDSNDILSSVKNNKIVTAYVFSGLETMDNFKELLYLIAKIRIYNSFDIVIYTGYYPNEVQEEINMLKEFDNVIVKFGRFIANSEPRYDEVLGITLASNNQFAERIS